MPSYRFLAAAIVFLPICLSCGAKYSRIQIQEASGITVTLRAQKNTPRYFSQPATISPVRIAHILSVIDVRKGQRERESAFHGDNIYEIGEALSSALKKADSNQEIIVQAVRSESRLGVFTSEHLNSFIAYVDGNELFIHLSKVNWKIPKQRGGIDLPEPSIGNQTSDFKVIASKGVVPVSTQSVSVKWRDPFFRAGSSLRFGNSGQLKRRTILLEEKPNQSESILDVQPSLLEQLTPDQLRELADLEEKRREGKISEGKYQRRKRDLFDDLESQ